MEEEGWKMRSINLTVSDIDVYILIKSYPCNRPWRPIGLWDVEAPTFSLDILFTDSGKVVSLMRRPPFTHRKIPGTHFR
jgi:hypothetical protein